MAIVSVNPATGEKLQEFSALSQKEIHEKLERARVTFQRFRRTSFQERALKMMRVAEILQSEIDHWSHVITLEMGKTIRSAREEVSKCAGACRFFAENAERFLADEVIPTQVAQSYIHFQPLGPILAIMPWNFPFWQVFRFAAPALMAGNVGLLKHASNVPQCALAIEGIFLKAGFPEGAFQTLLMSALEVDRVIRDPRVAAVTLTGSDSVGSKVARAAGESIKKVVLELGGSDPFIIMPSADLESAVKTAIRARTINNGESCIAAKRFIVAEEVADSFEKKFVEGMKNLKLGDPLDESTEIGPLATSQILETLARQVDETVKAGGRVLTGGKRLDRRGFFYIPSVITEIPANSPAFHDELFGPVAALFRVKNLAEALRLANATRFGLGSSFWSREKSEQKEFIEGIDAGLAFVNSMVASDARVPFGGIKSSGFGRELSQVGIREFMNFKTVWIGEK